MYHFPAESQLVHGARVQIFYEYITSFDQFGQNFLAVGSLGIQSQRLLVGVELQEIVARLVGEELELLAGCVALAGTLDLYYLGAQPCQHLRARGA